VVSLAENGTELKDILDQLDKALLDKALEWARKAYKTILAQTDKALAEHRTAGLQIEHLRDVWYQTCLGPVKIRRRQYREGKTYRYLLDEMMGMDKRSHVTNGVQVLALDLASTMPYRRSADILRKTSAIDMTHQTIWRLVAQAADPYLKKTEQELKWFQATGELPATEGKQVARLMVEADGVMLSLQREKERKTEVKLGIAYEGWESVGKERYKTVNKTIFAEVTGGNTFWAGMSLKLQKRYDLDRVGQTVVGGDGANWVKEGAGYVNGQFQLDRYHLNKELTTALGQDKETKGKVWQACQCGDVETGLRTIAEAMKQAKGERAQRIAKAYHYLQANRDGIEDYRLKLGEEGKRLRRTGAMEGNVDKLVVRRMKNQGMSWSLQGIRRLLCVRFLVLEGKLGGWLAEKKPSAPIRIPTKKMNRIVTNLSEQEPDTWLQAGLPALYGPHASHPWVSALRTITETPTL
jgi:Uncharacterised protein family (UPF0236)